MTLRALSWFISCRVSRIDTLNLSANTDPQQQEAASPQMLVVRLPLRYASP
jgi:hypothetical protein